MTRLLDVASAARIGDPMLAETNSGPSQLHLNIKKVLDHIEIARQEGATCVLGGKP
jgi:aldehyde dehydrogenase (NAD+)